MKTEIRERVLELDGDNIPYRLLRRRGRRRLTLKVEPREGLIVLAPARCPLKEIDAFLAREHDWLRLSLAELAEWEAEHPERRFVNGETLWLLGEDWALEVEERQGMARATVASFSNPTGPGRIRLRLPAGLPEPERVERARATLDRWYRRLARQLLEERVHYWEERIGKHCTGISVRDNRSRWGSCTSTGRLSFTWKIIMAPPEVVDYLVVHELCHLRHLDHSQEFWDCVALQIPDWKKHRQWLRKEGVALYL